MPVSMVRFKVTYESKRADGLAGQGGLEAEVPRRNWLGEFALNRSSPAADPRLEIVRALNRPICSLPLERLALGRSDAVIVCDDHTRLTPARLIVPEVLNRLNTAGIPDSRVSVVIATGTHRPSTAEEMRAKLGEETLARVRVENHDVGGRLVDMGRTRSGTVVRLNPRVAEADLVIGLGNIIPHRYCGWSGGAKIIQPGVTGVESTEATHLMIIDHPEIGLGITENPARREMEEVAALGGLAFIVNTVLNASGALVGVFAGDPVRAHRAGVERARDVYGVRMPGADVVVISSYPEDMNFWQGSKALYAAEKVVRPGGEIILVTPCPEGIGEHPEYARMLGWPCEEIRARLRRGEVTDPVSAAAAYAVRAVMRKARVSLVSGGITGEDADGMGMGWYPSLQEAIDAALRRVGPGATVLYVREGAEVLPIPDGEYEA